VGGIFINYRGDDSHNVATLIDRELVARLGGELVFLDNRSIPVGTDFVDELLPRLRSCSVLLVIIGQRWLTLTDTADRRRIDDPQDWVRREIVEAFAREIRVIPVLTDGAQLPGEGELPDDIADLSRRQRLRLPHRHTKTDLTVLIERILNADPELADRVRRINRLRRFLGVGLAVVLAVLTVVVTFAPVRAWLSQELSGSDSTTAPRRSESGQERGDAPISPAEKTTSWAEVTSTAPANQLELPGGGIAAAGTKPAVEPTIARPIVTTTRPIITTTRPAALTFHNNGNMSIIPNDTEDHSVDLDADPASSTDLELSPGQGDRLLARTRVEIALVPAGKPFDYATCNDLSWTTMIDSNALDPEPYDDGPIDAKICVKTDRGRLAMLSFYEGRYLPNADNSFHFNFTVWDI